MLPVSEAALIIAKQKTPKEAIKFRDGPGGLKFKYVEHAWVTEQLNKAFGHQWDWRIMENELKENEAIVRGRLTVWDGQGNKLVKEQFGTSQIRRAQGRPLSLGNNLKAASSDALKKCASLLGLALDIYRSEEEVGNKDDSRLTKSEVDERYGIPAPITEKQLAFIWVLGKTVEAYDPADKPEKQSTDFKAYLLKKLKLKVKSFSKISVGGANRILDGLKPLAEKAGKVETVDVEK